MNKFELRLSDALSKHRKKLKKKKDQLKISCLSISNLYDQIAVYRREASFDKQEIDILKAENESLKKQLSEAKSSDLYLTEAEINEVFEIKTRYAITSVFCFGPTDDLRKKPFFYIKDYLNQPE